MSDTTNRLPRLLTEAAVIVVSILLAFAVDAEWERRREARDREALFAALEQDMSAVVDEIDRVVVSRTTAHNAAGDLLVLVQNGSLAEVDAVELSVLVADLAQAATFDAPLGSVDALLSGGRLELLDDPALARLITALPSSVEDMDREQMRAFQYQDAFYRAISDQGFNGADLFDSREEYPWTVDPTGLAHFLSHPAVTNETGNLWYSHRETMRELADVREIVDSIRGRLANR